MFAPSVGRDLCYTSAAASSPTWAAIAVKNAGAETIFRVLPNHIGGLRAGFRAADRCVESIGAPTDVLRNGRMEGKAEACRGDIRTGRPAARSMPRMSETYLHTLDSISEEASGPSYSVPRLCEALAEDGADVVLMTIGSPRRPDGVWRHEAYRQDFGSVPILGRMRFSRGLRSGLVAAAQSAAIVHSHGLWLMPNVYPAWAARRAGRPLVISPRGMLGPAALRFSAKKKRLFWIALQARAMRAADCVHATSDLEYRDIRASGVTAPVAIIPNGIDVPSCAAKPTVVTGQNVVLYLGRLHGKKGLDQLLEAWAMIASGHPGWRLDIVGPIDSPYARDLQARLASSPNIRLAGPLYGDDKVEAYRRADVFVLPTLNENFGMTVAEALAQGTPVICTKGAPWEGLETNGCGWWVEQGAQSLAAALREAMSLDPARRLDMGLAGRRWMIRDFGWAAVGESMASVYRWLQGHAPRPGCVVPH